MTDPFFPPCPPIPKATGPVNLILPPTEDRIHKYFVLPNGLEVVAHLLSMGTKKYPRENAYSQYLASHNGSSNAYTEMTSTIYYFDVSPDALEEALDRFACFFVEPLFNEDCTDREIKAVDSEHKKNLQNDAWRVSQLEQSLSKPGHAYSKFGTGDYESLWSAPKQAGRDPRRELIEWWEREYCARRMKLCVAGKEDVGTLEKWVRERFVGVPVRTEGRPEVGPDGVRVAHEDSPYGPEQLGNVTFAKPVRDARDMELVFPLPDLDHLYQSRPTRFLSHFLAYKGHGSNSPISRSRGGPTSSVFVDLTPDGLQHYRDVALAIFKYTALLRSQPPSLDAFNEVKAIADISFKFAERGPTSGYCIGMSSWLQSPVPREKIVSSKWLFEEFREDELSKALQLLDPRRARVNVTCKELPTNVEGTWDGVEKIYGTEYKQIKLDEAFMEEAISGAPIPELQLPGPNQFIPEKLDVEKFEVTEIAKRPVVLRDTPLSRLWYKRDDRFWLPKANLNIMLHSPIPGVTPRNSVLFRLYCELFSDAITEDICDATTARLYFSVWNAADGIEISASGFSDKLALLTEVMLENFVSSQVNEARFKEIAEQSRLQWRSFAVGEPYSIARFWNQYATYEQAWTREEKLEELEHITVQDVQAFGKEVLSRLHIETLVHGNTSREGATEIQDMLERVLHPRKITSSELLSGSRCLTLPDSKEFIWEIPGPNPSEMNSVVIYKYQVGDPADVTLRNHLSLFSQIAREPCFDVLRTKQQLGYRISGHSSHATASMGYSVTVQSERDPVYVETRVEAFLDSLKELIEEMSGADFENHKQSLIEEKEERPKNLGEETQRFWGRISDGYYEFAKRENDIAALRKTTKQNVLNILMTYIHTSSPTRAKLSIYLKSQYKGVKFDPESSGPLVEHLTKAGVTVDPAAMQELLSSNPDLESVKKFAVAAIDVAGGVADEVKAGLKATVAELKGQEASSAPAAGDADAAVEAAVQVRKKNVWIDNIHEFKAKLVPSKAPVPVEPL
ncbi:hypothetical protein IAT38_006882 [Cryptococcus sp. DSM 104549]